MNDEELRRSIGTEIDSYLLRMRRIGEIDRRVQDVRTRRLSPLHFWEIEASYYPLLSKIAKITFAMVSSNASVERSFKTCGNNILTKSRNRLSTVKVAKMAKISTNFKLLNNVTQKRKLEEVNEVDNNDSNGESSTGENSSDEFDETENN